MIMNEIHTGLHIIFNFSWGGDMINFPLVLAFNNLGHKSLYKE